MFGQNLRYLRKQKKISQEKLSHKLGIARTTLGDYERGKTEPNFGMLVKVANYFNVDLDTLIRHKMKYQKTKPSMSKPLKILSITVDRQNREIIQLVHSKARAGYIEGFQDPEYIADLPHLNVPTLPHGSYRAFEIEGDSMYPLPSGTIVICKYIEHLKEIKDGKCYVVISAKDGVVYKRLRNDSKNQRIILLSDNDYYLPYTLSYADIQELWMYRAHISFTDPHMDKATISMKLDSIQKSIRELKHLK